MWILISLTCVIYCTGIPVFSKKDEQSSDNSGKSCELTKVSERTAGQVANVSSCPSTIATDENEFRIPQTIVKITCQKNPPSCNCQSPYECVQLTSTVEVYYFNKSSDNEIISLNKSETETITYESGCVCALLSVVRGRNIRANHLS